MIKKINFLFLFAITVTLIFLVWLDYKIEEKNRQIIFYSYFNAYEEFIPLIENKNFHKLEKFLKVKNFELISYNLPAKTVYIKRTRFGNIVIKEKGFYYYLIINYFGKKYIFFDKTQKLLNEKLLLYIFMFFVVLILVALYVYILSILRPLQEISDNLFQFSNGNYEMIMEVEGEQKIKQLSKSFNKMAVSVKETIQEREDFIKYIGHELKTPLTRLKFAIESKDLKKISSITSNIEMLINQLLYIHLITQKNMEKNRFLSSTLIVEAISKLYLDEEKIDIEIEDFEIEGDLNYLSMALKNLIENAVKYTDKYPIKIVVKDKKIIICNFSQKINMSLDEMTKLFIKKSNSGFGVGLNLVQRVCNIHNIKFDYFYKDAQNCFSLTF